ncbi:MAG TPA: hypothetical protein VN156_19030 [Pseudomonas sp.]|nr:hypothetical protein [Pseudomonas sp.]
MTVLEQVGLGRLRDQLGRQAEWSRELPHCTVIGVSHQVAVQGLFQRALNLLPTPLPQAEAVV